MAMRAALPFSSPACCCSRRTRGARRRGRGSAVPRRARSGGPRRLADRVRALRGEPPPRAGRRARVFNLANCREKLGQLATAWQRFREVKRAAAARVTSASRVTEQRIAALEPRLPKLTLERGASGRGGQRHARRRRARHGQLRPGAAGRSRQARDRGARARSRRTNATRSSCARASSRRSWSRPASPRAAEPPAAQRLRAAPTASDRRQRRQRLARRAPGASCSAAWASRASPPAP